MIPNRNRKQQLSCEPLENRLMLATCTVDRGGDDIADGDLATLRGTLRFCVEAFANQNMGFDEVVIAPEFNAPQEGPNMIGLSSGKPIKITDDVIVRDELEAEPGAFRVPTIIRGISSRIFTVDNPERVLEQGAEIRGVNLRGGNGTNGDTPDFFDGFGGAILARESLRLVDVTVTSNASKRFGGAVAVVGNVADDAVNIEVKNSSIIDNNTGGDGGGLFVERAQLSIEESALRDNTAVGAGGGLWLGSLSKQTRSQATINESIISGNRAVQGEGGGVAIYAADLVLNQSTVDMNASNEVGGGISVSSRPSMMTASRLSLNNSTISRNTTAGSGGGIWAVDADLQSFQSTISGNNAGADAGGIGLTVYDMNLTGGALIESTTIAGNAAENAGGLLFDGGPQSVNTVVNSVVADNSANGQFADASGEFNVIFSLFGNSMGTGIDPVNPGTNIVNVDAMLSQLGGNGGRTSTHVLMPGSPAIDAGGGVSSQGTDQRGFVRLVGQAIDMGSTEFGSAPPAATGDFNADGTFDCVDIDALVAEVVSGNNSTPFDLNADGQVDPADVTIWRSIAGNANLGPGLVYLIADANLDGVVDISDFNLWNSNKFSNNNGWCGADFNIDGQTDVSDFNLWNARKFSSSFPSPPSLGRVPTSAAGFHTTDVELTGSQRESSPQLTASSKAPATLAMPMQVRDETAPSARRITPRDSYFELVGSTDEAFSELDATLDSRFFTRSAQ